MADENTNPVGNEPTEFVDTGISSDASGDEWGEFLDGFIDDESVDTPRSADVVDEVVEGLTEKPSGDEVPAPVVETPTETPEPTPADTVEVVTDELQIPAPAEVTPPSAVDHTQQREQYRQQLIAGYKLSEEDAEAFDLNPAEALPKFAAELHLRVLENVMATVQNVLPNQMSTIIAQQTTAKQNEDEFFAQWPELKGHNALIGQKATEFRQKNPQASKEDAIRMVGFNTLISLGVDPVQAAERLRKGINPPAAQSAPTPKPHVPTASVRTGGVQRTQPPADNIWQEMLED